MLSLYISTSLSSSTGGSSFIIEQNDNPISQQSFGLSTTSITSEELPLLIDQHLQQLDRPSISKIFIDIGPGSFTGLRAGIAYATGLSFAFNSQVYTVSSFSIMLNTVNNPNVLCLIPFKTGELYYKLNQEKGIIATIHLTELLNKCSAILYSNNSIAQDTGGKKGELSEPNAQMLLNGIKNNTITPITVPKNTAIMPYYIGSPSVLI